MFRHVVMLSLTQPLETKDADYITSVCEEMERELDGLISMRLVENLSNRSPSHTHAFVADFVNEAAHDRYQQAPIHILLKQKVAELAESLVVLDYEL